MQENELMSERKADTLLKICSLLMTSGANTSRIFVHLKRFSDLIKVDAQVFIDHKAFIITLLDNETQQKTTQIRRLPGHGINFAVLSALSRAGLKAKTENWTFEQIDAEVDRIAGLKHYPRIVILIAVSFSGAGFCNLFGGDIVNMLIAFFATMGGLFVRQEAVKRKFNPYVSVLFGAFVAASLASSTSVLLNHTDIHLAIATSVLFLIPGVPLINSVTDILDGYIITGSVRFINGFVFVLAIALALFMVMYLFSIQNL